jgi:hypothetical protein
MTELLDTVVSWRSLLLVVVVFGFAPGFCLRLLVRAYPRSDPRRTELIAELYTVPRIERPLWVAEQLETALFEGLPRRLSAVLRRGARQRRARAEGGPEPGLWLGLGAVLWFGLGAGLWAGLVFGLWAGLWGGLWFGLGAGLWFGLGPGLWGGLGAVLWLVFGAWCGAGIGAGFAVVLWVGFGAWCGGGFWGMLGVVPWAVLSIMSRLWRVRGLRDH